MQKADLEVKAFRSIDLEEVLQCVDTVVLSNAALKTLNEQGFYHTDIIAEPGEIVCVGKFQTYYASINVFVANFDANWDKMQLLGKPLSSFFIEHLNSIARNKLH